MDNDDIYSPQVPYNPHGNLQTNPQGNMSKVSSSFVDFIQTLVLFGAIFAIIYLFIAQPHKVAGSSMLPTYQDGNFILTDKVSYKMGEPKRGDVIVLKNPQNEKQDFIKRIIALPDDRVKVFGGKVFINEKEVEEKYLPNGRITSPGSFLREGVTHTVEVGKYIVMGDNREHSSDSREWGMVTRDKIIGKVFFRYWPINQLGITQGL